MAAQVDTARQGTVVELGAGTGAVTRALLERGISRDRLVVVEHNAAFCRRLRAKFADVCVLQGDAGNLQSLLAEQGVSRIGAVISSLPLLSLRGSVQDAVLKDSFGILEGDGAFVQFTYGLVSPIAGTRLRTLGLEGRLVERVWRNLPPASVWCYTSRTNASRANDRKKAVR